jgi:excisionase family DNA binding protein
MTAQAAAPVPRLAFTPEEAARALGVSRDFLDMHILPELRIVRRGRKVLVPVRELERWLDRAAAVPLAAELEARAATKARGSSNRVSGSGPYEY